MKTVGQTVMENVKTAVNLFVRLILCSYSRNIILNGYLLHRTTRFLLVVLTSLAKPSYYKNTSFLQTTLRLHFDKWLCVVLEQITQLVANSPRVDDIKEGTQPSVAVSLDSEPSYRNAVIIALVEDDGLFSMETFQWALEYCEEHNILSSRRRRDFGTIVTQLKEYNHHFESLSKVLEDCPDEFLDSVMDTIMQDPVILPSGNRVDRSTVVRQLTVKAIDPFTRAPLSMDKVVPDTELKQRIKDYLKQRMEELKSGAIHLDCLVCS